MPEADNPAGHGVPGRTLHVVAWPDPVIDTLGFDPRSSYVERYWLGILGPSTTWLLRHLASELEARPDGVDLDLSETARSLGLGARGGRNSPFVRALTRLAQFDLARPHGDGALALRRRVPPLSLRQVRHLTPTRQAAHQRWQQDQLQVSPTEHRERRARQLALSLFELGEDREATKRQLLSWDYQPDLAERATSWGWDRHRRALEVATGPTNGRDADHRVHEHALDHGAHLSQPTVADAVRGPHCDRPDEVSLPPRWLAARPEGPRLNGPADSLGLEL